MKHKTIALLLVFAFLSCAKPPLPPTSSSRIGYNDFSSEYIKVDAPVIALSNAKIIDGAGGSSLSGQTILIEDGYIKAVGPTEAIEIPIEAELIDLKGHTIIPGLIGTHNHTHMPGITMMDFTAPRMYLASGVTTIQTTGSAEPALEKHLADSIRNGLTPGPDIIHTGPYFNGADGSAVMITPRDRAHVEEVIGYWASQGVKWFKVYRHITPENLRMVIEVAHDHGVKITGHLCSITYTNAARMGIDAIEHGFIHTYDYSADKSPGVCSGSRAFRDELAIDSEAVGRVHQTLIDHGVAISTTLAIFEAQVPSRAIADERTLRAMSPTMREAYNQRRIRMLERGDDWHFKEEWLEKSMAHDLAFFKRGGLLTAGLDPGLHNLPGFGDQRNYQLLVEAGFSAGEAIQVMTSNGAQLLDLTNVGRIEVGKRADLVVLDGDLEAASEVIENVVLVFKEGYGFDPATLLAEVDGQMGVH